MAVAAPRPSRLSQALRTSQSLAISPATGEHARVLQPIRNAARSRRWFFAGALGVAALAAFAAGLIASRPAGKARVAAASVEGARQAPAARATDDSFRSPHAGPQIIPLPSATAPAAAAAAAAVAPRATRVATTLTVATGRAKAARAPDVDPFEDADARKTPAAPVAAPSAVAAADPIERGTRPASPAAPANTAPASPRTGELDSLIADATRSKARGASTVDEVLRNADRAAPAGTSGTPRAAAGDSAPTALSRSQITLVMAGVQAQARACRDRHGEEGQIALKISVAPDGHVKNVETSGPLDGTPTGACVKQAVAAVRFPASPGVRFDYPLSVR
jgi:hypothetical protein